MLSWYHRLVQQGCWAVRVSRRPPLLQAQLYVGLDTSQQHLETFCCTQSVVSVQSTSVPAGRPSRRHGGIGRCSHADVPNPTIVIPLWVSSTTCCWGKPIRSASVSCFTASTPVSSLCLWSRPHHPYQARKPTRQQLHGRRPVRRTPCRLGIAIPHPKTQPQAWVRQTDPRQT